MKHTLATLAAALLLSPLCASAQTPAPQDALSRCFADSTTGKDRKDLARWIFLAMAVHPEIKQYSSPDAAKAAEDTDKLVAAMITRLLSESCLQQTQAAVKQGGPTAVHGAFQLLGQLAMQELMSDGKVASSMSSFQKYVDQNKLNPIFGVR